MSKKTEEKRPKRRWMRRIALALAVLVAALAGYSAIEACVVRLEYADVYLKDLPEQFEHTRVLFLSDIHVDEFNSPRRAANLVLRMQALAPDLLLLGGDYSSLSWPNQLAASLGLTTREEAQQREQARRDQFFLLIDPFRAALGKYGVAGNHDYELDELRASMLLGGVRLLENQVTAIERNGAQIVLAGLADWSVGEQRPDALAAQVRADDCAIVLSHSPDALPALHNRPSRDGARWVDLMLSGHTHAGQVTWFGLKPVLLPSIYGDRYWRGWYRENGATLLVSNGTGTTGLPLRLGAPPKAHLLTLHRAQSE